jgi:hypothetical protein
MKAEIRNSKSKKITEHSGIEELRKSGMDFQFGIPEFGISIIE